MMENKYKIGVIGLGYVGFPLACLFARKYPVIGFDINEERIKEINAGIDSTNEVTAGALETALANGMVCLNVVMANLTTKHILRILIVLSMKGGFCLATLRNGLTTKKTGILKAITSTRIFLLKEIRFLLKVFVC